MKKIGDSKRILVGWGRKGDRLCYFLSHKAIKKTLKDPVCCSPEDLQVKMKDLVDSIDGGKSKRSIKNS